MPEYYVVKPNGRSVRREGFVIGDAEVYTSLDNALKAFDRWGLTIRLDAPKIVRVHLPHNYSPDDTGKLTLPAATRGVPVPTLSEDAVYDYFSLLRSPESTGHSDNPLDKILNALKADFEAYKVGHGQFMQTREEAAHRNLFNFAGSALAVIEQCRGESPEDVRMKLETLHRLARFIGSQRPQQWLGDALKDRVFGVFETDAAAGSAAAAGRLEARPQGRSDFFSPKRDQPQSNISSITKNVVAVLTQYQHQFENQELQIRDRIFKLSQLKLQHWPEQPKERYLAAQMVLKNLQTADLTEKQIYIILKQGLTAAERIDSKSLIQIFSTALDNPVFKRIQSESLLRSQTTPFLQSQRFAAAEKDKLDIPVYFRCSLTGAEITGTPVTLMNGKTYDLNNIHSHLEKNGFDTALNTHFKEELEANPGLKTLLNGKDPITKEVLGTYLVINRPLLNLLEKNRKPEPEKPEEPDFCCSISLEPMEKPVLSVAGHGYSAASLEQALSTRAEDPQTRAPMTILQMRPNNAIEEAMADNQHLFGDDSQPTTTPHRG